ncbi:hypothetical protein D9619_011421 [Psilocybe cf. subviscida]|uniref:Uncharacterized protein n=1 Tax=Psilocybe cf. subviscida TaxID=2480587 RepID=A0A8H5BKL0_9AGAR|nr:hypothetical protein D9619_011421 [Psilocybe cf. subviscida]
MGPDRVVQPISVPRQSPQHAINDVQPSCSSSLTTVSLPASSSPGIPATKHHTKGSLSLALLFAAGVIVSMLD